MANSQFLATAAIAALALAGTANAAPVQLAFTGSLAGVFTDTGTGQLGGTAPGTVFSGAFSYDPIPGPSGTYPFGANYPVAGLAVLVRGEDLVLAGTDLILTINNDEPLNPDPADLINDLVGPVPPAVAGMPTDGWSLSALQAGASRGPDDATISGVQWDILMLSLTDTLYANLEFRPLPPASGDVQVRALLVVEGDGSGNPLFEGLVLLDELVVVPVPPALWLLVSALTLLGVRRGTDRG